jgi:hypothetical protein
MGQAQQGQQHPILRPLQTPACVVYRSL